MDGRTKRRLDTRRQLLNAGAQLLDETDDELNVASVIERAGVSHGTFYNHFPSVGVFMEELVQSVSQVVMMRLLEALPPEDALDMRVSLAYVMSQMVAIARRDPRVATLTAAAPAGHGDHDTDAIAMRVHVYGKAIEAGLFLEQDPALLEISARRVIHGAVTHYHDSGFSPTAERDTATIMLRLSGVEPAEIERVLARVDELVAMDAFEMPTLL